MTTDAAVQLSQFLILPVRLCMYALDCHDNDQNLSANWLLNEGMDFLAKNLHLHKAGGPVIALSPSSYCSTWEPVDTGTPLKVMALFVRLQTQASISKVTQNGRRLRKVL